MCTGIAEEPPPQQIAQTPSLLHVDLALLQ